MKKSRQETLAHTGLFHKIWKGHNGQKVLRTNAEKRQYLTQLCEKKSKKIRANVQWHSYCIMSNHPHETGRAGWNYSKRGSRKKGITELGNWMRNAHSAYGMWYNKLHSREGKVSCARPKTTQMRSEADVLNAMLYGDANPVRAGMVTHPSKYKWSTYRFYAYGEENEFTSCIDPPEAYMALGRTPKQRQRAYRSLMDCYLRKNGLLQDRPDESNIPLEHYDSVFMAIEDLLAANTNRARGTPQNVETVPR